MQVWGIEDIDLGLKCWLMGYSIVHDPVPLVGHRFRKAFPYVVPPEHIAANRLRMAFKHFDEPMFSRWLPAFRARDPGVFERAWELFCRRSASAERERDYLAANRERDLRWYVEHFSVPTGGLVRRPNVIEAEDL
jgi:hypothetical protein